MKCIKLLLLVFFFLIFKSKLFAQFPIQKDIKVGVEEIKIFMRKNKFTFFKQEIYKAKKFNPISRKHDIEVVLGIVLLFKEEVSVYITKNGYDNITGINYSCEHRELFKKLKNVMNFIDWQQIIKRPLNIPPSSTYEYNSLIIKVLNEDSSKGIYQIICDKEDQVFK